MDLKPRYENLTRTVTFSFGIAGLLLAMLVDSILGDRWLSVVPLLFFMVTLVIYFHLRAQLWFWAVIVPLVIAQLVLIYLFPVPREIGVPLLLMVAAILDLILMVACIKFIRRQLMS